MQITRSISNCNSHYAATCFELCHMSNQCISTCVCLWKIPDIKNVILTRHNIVNPRKPAPNSIHFSSFFVYVQSPGLLSVKIPVWADVSRRVEGVCYCRLGEKKKKKKKKEATCAFSKFRCGFAMKLTHSQREEEAGRRRGRAAQMSNYFTWHKMDSLPLIHCTHGVDNTL